MTGCGATTATSARAQLLGLIQTEAVVPAPTGMVLSSGGITDYYVNLRLITLTSRGLLLVGRAMHELVADWYFSVVGGLTLGADPVALAMVSYSAWRGHNLKACVVRKEAKKHGTGDRIEGPDVSGELVLAVEDTSTTGGSVMEAVTVLREAGAEVVGVAVMVDREAGAREAVEAAGLPYRAAFTLSEVSAA
jgi:orotate phosphoribosyltransferase